VRTITRLAVPGLLALSLVVPALAADRLDRAGAWTPPVLRLQSAASALATITDGSFELGPPPASAWTEVNDTSCERIGDFSGEWYVSAFDGTYDFWAGGYCYDESSGLSAPVTASLRQTLTVPADSAVLSFHYIAYRADADDSPLDGDRAFVAVDGVEVWSLPFQQSSNTYPEWAAPVLVDLRAYAGQSVELTVGGVSVGEATGNARLDAFSFVANSTPATRRSWGALKTIYR
jgi:hypothetical protein